MSADRREALEYAAELLARVVAQRGTTTIGPNLTQLCFEFSDQTFAVQRQGGGGHEVLTHAATWAPCSGPYPPEARFKELLDALTAYRRTTR